MENSMTENTTPPQTDNIDMLLDRTRKQLKKHPNMSVGDFFVGYLVPLIDEMRAETEEIRVGVEELWDYIGELPEEPLLSEVEQMFLMMSGFIDQMLVRAGWLSKTGPTDMFPVDMREQFLTIARKLTDLQERVAKARTLVEDGVEDEDDADAEEIGAESSGAAASSEEVR
jgi:hypothetical protein